MSLTSINDLEIERLLIFMRRSMLRETMEGSIKENGLPFAAALALHCFVNEYVYPETDEEKQFVKRLQQQIAELVEQTQGVPPSLIATLGAYRPLHKFTWAQKLADRQWDSNINAVITRQILEPVTELSLRSQLPCLTPVQDTVSQSVRDQYEENPYPRWVNTGIQEKGKAIGSVLRDAPLSLDLGNYVSPEKPEILIAGCGTGQHSLFTANRFSNSRVYAVDLSLSSLSYALRKTEELDVTNIEYAQADIMELGSLGRQFDIIESVGVLHHLGDPLVGWKVLVDLLRPGGLMNLGLYSETARQYIVAGRSLIAEKGYTTSHEDIRQCRQDVITRTENGDLNLEKLLDRRDFYSLSECRDLLFHVQEHRFTLPQIESALKSLKLEFLGFEMRDQNVMRKFKETYPKKSALTSLPQWHKFELNNPDTFWGMYQFWCRKM
jgi:2-polyprenyl-3-methyl-5-hydroxy-6-metoxy-1,4-benzoquinol methylase